MNSIWEDFAKYIFHVEVEIEPAAAAADRAHALPHELDREPQLHGRRPGAALGALRRGRAGRRRDRVGRGRRRGEELAALPEVETRHVDERDKIGRNDPCWCGSGKKFKKCHGA